MKFDTDDDVICTVRTGLCEQDKAWYWLGVHTLVPCWHKFMEVDRVFVEKLGVESNIYSTVHNVQFS